MFEQSILLDHAGAKKTGALAASLTLQTAFVGVLIAIPLIFGDRLPKVPIFIPLTMGAPPPPPPPAHVETAASSSTSRASASAQRIFTAPKRIVDLSQIPDVGFVEAPPAFANSSADGVPGGTGVPSLMAQVFHEPIQPPKPRIVDPPKAPAKPTVVGGDVQSAKLLRKVIPVYPPLARQARVSGTVRLMGVIAKDGTIQQLQVVSGYPMLVGAAMDAVRQWVYRPTLLNGQAVEVIAPIDVIFSLGQ